VIIKVSSHRKAAVCYWFDNGNTVSIIFGAGTYCDNYEMDYALRNDPSLIDSKTVEILPGGNESFIRWMEKKYDGVDVCGYVPVEEIPAILKRADSRYYKK
jgi:hypothetical protein